MEYCLYVCLGIGVGSDKKKFFIESDVLRVKLCFSGLGLRALSIVCILFVSCLFSLQSSNYFFFDENSNKFVDFDNIYSIFIIHDWQNHLKSPNILFKLTSNTIFAINVLSSNCRREICRFSGRTWKILLFREKSSFHSPRDPTYYQSYLVGLGEIGRLLHSSTSVHQRKWNT